MKINELLTENQSKYQEGISVIQMLEAIVKAKSAKEVRFAEGKSKVDLYTASAVMKVFDAVNEENKRKILNMIGTRDGFMKIAKFAFAKTGAKTEMGEMTSAGSIATSMGGGNGFANGGPGTMKRADSTRKKKKKSK